MVERKNNPNQFLTFTRGEKTAQVECRDKYTSKDAAITLATLGLATDASKLYKIIHEFAPNSKTSASGGGRVQHNFNSQEFRAIIDNTIQRRETRIAKNDRHYTIDIDNETVIELKGITDYKWKIYKPLLDALRTTRRQTESGEIQRTPIPFEIVKSFFPKNAPTITFYDATYELNVALEPNGWSVEREGKADTKGRKPFDAPWYLSGPDENSDQKNGQPNLTSQKTSFERSVNEQRKRIAEKHFDRIDYGTKLLHSCLTHHTNPDAKKFFTKNLEKFMKSNLPTDLKLQDVIDNISLEEYFEDIIIRAALNMSYKRHQQLSVKQKAIADLWQVLSTESGQHPLYVIFDHFSGHDSNNPSDEVSNDIINSEEDIIKPKATRGRPKGKNKVVTHEAIIFSKQS